MRSSSGAERPLTDDPLLTARPAGSARRRADRARLASRAAAEQPACPHGGRGAGARRRGDLRRRVSASRRFAMRGVEVWQAAAADRGARLGELLDELGRRQMTNVLVEGGAELLGTFFDLGAVDEVHVFVAPKIVGGLGPIAVGGRGVGTMAEALATPHLAVQRVGDDMPTCTGASHPATAPQRRRRYSPQSVATTRRRPPRLRCSHK